MIYTDIQADVHFLVGTDSVSYPIASLTRNANRAYERVTSLLIKNSSRWQFDDTNNTDLPIATTALVADQQDYSIDVNHLRITRVEVQDEAGNWIKLSPFDQADLYQQSLTDFMGTAGTPLYYDKIANSIFLYPKPSYSQAASLKVWFQREPSYFTTSDTTKEPGFNPLYHRLIPLWAAYDYAIANQITNAISIKENIDMLEGALVEDVGERDKDDRPRLSVRKRYFR
jgi:hypothetical protein